MMTVAMLVGLSGLRKRALLRAFIRRIPACLLLAAFFAGSSHAVDLYIYGGGGGGGGTYSEASGGSGGQTGSWVGVGGGDGGGEDIAGGGGGGGAAFVGGALPADSTAYNGLDGKAGLAPNAGGGGAGGTNAATNAGNGGTGGNGNAAAGNIAGSNGDNYTSLYASNGGAATNGGGYGLDNMYGGAAGGAGGGVGGSGYRQAYGNPTSIDYGGGGGGGGGTASMWSGASGSYGAMQIVGGGGGGGGLGGGGGGGNAILQDYNALISVADNLSIGGGAGGNGGSYSIPDALGSGGGGGGGGAGALTYGDNDLNVGGSLSLAGGAGGAGGSYDGGYGGNGGSGGGAYLTMGKGTLAVTGGITLAAGNGGSSGVLEFANERGGQGGDVVFTSSGAVAATTLTVTAGDGGTVQPGDVHSTAVSSGRGGSATFSAASLAAGTVNVLSGGMGSALTGLGTAGTTAFTVSGLVDTGDLGSFNVEQKAGAIAVNVGRLRTDNASFTSNTADAEANAGGYSANVGVFDLTRADDIASREVTLTIKKSGVNTQSDVLSVDTMLWRGTTLTIQDDGNATMSVKNIRLSGSGAVYRGGTNNYAFSANGVNLYFDVTDVNAGSTMLTVAPGSVFDITGANLDVDFTGKPGLALRETITLINAADSAGEINTTLVKEYGATEHTFQITHAGGTNDLLLEYVSENLNLNKASSYFHGSASRYALLTTASDLIIDQGIPLAVGSTSTAIPNNYGPAFYAATSYTKQRYDLGSHVDSGNLNLVVGAAFLRCAGSIRTYFGPFIEGGWGDYVSKNKNLANTLKAEGDAYNVGGGFLARVESDVGLYLEASLKGGWIYSDYESDDLGIGTAEYDSSTWYYGGHIGLGYDFEINECNRVAAYGMGIYNRQARDSVRNNMEEKIEFDRVESLRSRLGFRYTHTLVEDTRIYLGAAWEHEYKGEIGGLVQGIRLPDAPTTKGDTGVAELGAKWRSRSCGWELDLSVRGYFGERSGVAGSIGVGNVF